MESKSKKDGVKIYSSDFTVPTKDVKEQRGYPNLEESKALIKHNKYLCHGCKKKFNAIDSTKVWIHCDSDFIEVDEGQPELKVEWNSGGLSGFFSKFVRDASEQLGGIYESIGGSLSGSVETVKNLGKEIKPTFNRTIGELASVKDIVLYKSQRNDNGEVREVEVKLEDTYRPFLIKFGLMNKNNPHAPAFEEDINKLEEVKITEADYKLNEETNQMEEPQWLICIWDLNGKGIKPEWGHLFHKDCLFPWIRIHNRWPVCGQIVAK